MPPADSPRQARRPVHPLWLVLKPLASLQVTVVLFACSLVLVFFGTLAQKTTGLWDAVAQYFWSWGVLIDLAPSLEFGKIFLGLPKDWVAPSWVAVPWPGGKLLGLCMFVNLLAAHIMRFKFSWKRIGVTVSHSGLLLLGAGEYVTREFQVEQRMVIREGDTVNYASDHRLYEVAFTRANPDGTEHVAVIPEVKLRRAARKGTVIRHPDLPCDVRVNAYYTNSRLRDTSSLAAEELPDPAPTGGLAVRPKSAEWDGPVTAVKTPDVSGVEQNAANAPSLYVTFLKKDTDEVIGTYLLSAWFDTDVFNPETRERQAVKIDGAEHDLDFRPARYYKPFSLHLTPGGFRFDKYTGTQTAKNYSSDLLVIDPERGPDRPVTVRMNEPLRHRGETFYQADFDKRTEKTTVLQVVRNPGWLIPYIACTMVTVGLLFHFLVVLTTFLTRQSKLGRNVLPAPSVPFANWSWNTVWVPLAAVAFGLLLIGSKARPPANPAKLDLTVAAKLPVVDGGRVKPLDTVARVCLRKISGREEYVGADDSTYPAIKWLMDALSTPFLSDESAGPAGGHRVVRIDNGQVQDLLKLPRREGSRYSLKEIEPQLHALVTANRRYEAMKKAKKGTPPPANPDRIDRLFESGDRDVFGGQLAETYERVDLYRRLCQRRIPLMLAPADGRDWQSLGEVEGAALMEARVRVVAASGKSREEARAILTNMFEELSAGDPGDDSRSRLRAAVDDLDREARPLMPDILLKDRRILPAVELLTAYRSQDQTRFDAAVEAFGEASAAVSPADRSKASFEVFLNNLAPAYHVMYLYVLALFLTFVGWAVMAGNPDVADQIRRAAFWTTVVAFAVHTFALLSRMYVSDRWFVFVTNLYSSAVFIGWAAVALGLLLESLFKLGLGNALAAVLGGATAIIAHNLAASGDTLEMMQAVLDTNFWLAVHVTTVTFGYSATFAAGLVGILYIVLGLFTPLYQTREVAAVTAAGVPVRGTDVSKMLGNVIYGIVCLATLLSFFGTVSGGIWADQSWGRFWGWDPKENGAVLIVIWNALILHARWCGLVKERGMAVLALGGNMITTWSWFGTNQLSVGLHAYGFSQTLALGCTVTWIVHLGLIGAGCLPKSLWFGFAKPPKA